MSRATRVAHAGIYALLALQFAWHAWLSPPPTAPALAMALFFALPILPPAILAVLGHRRAAFWGGLAALLYFSLGVLAVGAPAPAGLLAWLQVVLSVLLVVAAGWDGLRARFGGRKGGPAV